MVTRLTNVISSQCIHCQNAMLYTRTEYCMPIIPQLKIKINK